MLCLWDAGMDHSVEIRIIKMYLFLVQLSAVLLLGYVCVCGVSFTVVSSLKLAHKDIESTHTIIGLGLKYDYYGISYNFQLDPTTSNTTIFN